MPPVNQKSDIGKAMEKKEKSIENFQKNKEEGMKLMSAGRDATMIVTAKLAHKDMSDDEIQSEIKKWSHWMYTNVYNAPFL